MAINLNKTYNEPDVQEIKKHLVSETTRRLIHLFTWLIAMVCFYLIIFSKVVDIQTERTLVNELYDNVRIWVADQNHEKQAKPLNFTQTERELVKSIDLGLSKRFSGRILIQAEGNGEIWYVYPDDLKKYYFGQAEDVSMAIKKFGIGETHSVIAAGKVGNDLAGRILIDIDDIGKSYYASPKDKKLYYLGGSEDALKIFREQAEKISNSELRQIDVGDIDMLD